MSETTRVSRYQKGKTRKVKTSLDLLEQEIVSGSGICWAICKSASHPRQPRQHPTTQFLQAGCPSCRQHNSVKALKAATYIQLFTIQCMHCKYKINSTDLQLQLVTRYAVPCQQQQHTSLSTFDYDLLHNQVTLTL